MSSLRIAIVGGGLGGLAAAVALRRQGHAVQVFESSHEFNELGAAIGCPPNAVRILDRLGSSNERVMGVEYAGIQSFSHSGGAGLTASFGNIKEKYGNEWRLCHRVDMHNELQALAFGEQGDGPPAKLHLGTRVKSCDAEQGLLTLDTGEAHEADLIIAADGIKSTLRGCILDSNYDAPPSTIASYRWLIDADRLGNDPALDWVLRDGPSGPRMVSSPDFRVLFLYPCRGKSLINAMGIHTETRDPEEAGTNVPSTRQELLDKFSDFGPQFQRFLELTETVRLWQLRSLPDLPTWTKGRVCLLGDAAHAMLPTIGQGAAMAFEDAITLAALIPIGTGRERIPFILRAYEGLRKERAEYVKNESLEQLITPGKRATYYRTPEMQQMVMGYDAEGAAMEYKKAHFG